MPSEHVLVSKLRELFHVFQCVSQCRQESRPSTVWCQSGAGRENSSLATDRLGLHSHSTLTGGQQDPVASPYDPTPSSPPTAGALCCRNVIAYCSAVAVRCSQPCPPGPLQCCRHRVKETYIQRETTDLAVLCTGHCAGYDLSLILSLLGGLLLLGPLGGLCH